MRLSLLITAAALALVVAPSASAVPPPNDAFETASVVASIPFNSTEDLTEATTQAGEPQSCSFKSRSVWYRFQPATTTPVRIGLAGSSPGMTATVFRSFGGGIFNLSFEGCVFGGTTTLNAQAGGVYYIQVGKDFSLPALAQLSIEAVPPPVNDNLANAKQVGALPYSDVVPMLASTVEPGEPNPTGALGTAWWSLTAQEDASLLIGEAGCCGTRIANVYTGAGMASLEPVSVTRSFGRAILNATAGTTYLIQLAHNGLFSSGDIGISVQVAPTPSVSIFHSPFDPSSVDTIGFSGNAFDPAAFPVATWTWDFGDGTTAEGQSAPHRYAADGDYDVTLTIHMSDGRTASSTRTVNVRTHDVSVTKLVVPKKASEGRSHTLKVTVVSSRYDEDVTVRLLRSTETGFVQLGSSTQFVAVDRRGTEFVFAYTFTSADAALGKVTFKAVATIGGARDALPSDNELAAPPTAVG